MSLIDDEALANKLVSLYEKVVWRFSNRSGGQVGGDDMFRIVLTVSVLGAVFMVAVWGHAADLQDGFFDLKWGANISELDGFSKIEEHLGVSYFVRPGKVYSISDKPIDDVIYGFTADKLFAVYINIESLDVYGQIRRYLRDRFGYPETSMTMKNQQTIHKWKYQNTKIKLKSYEATGKIKLAFYYTPLAVEVNEAQQEAFQEKRKPVFPLDGQRQQRAVEALDLLKF